MSNKYHVDKKTISLEEYEKLFKEGARRPFCRKGVGLKPDGVSEIVRVELKCKRCGKIFTTQFSQIKKRSCLDLCTQCINHYKRSKENAERDSSYYENPEYRRKLSEGVKRHYKKEGVDASRRRTDKRFENFELNKKYPNYAAIKVVVEGIRCESFGEGVFVKWMKNEGYNVSRCEFALKYEFEGKIRHYLPDFKIEKDGLITIVEVKSDYERNFQKSYEVLQKRVEEGLQYCNNLSTYRKDVLSLKLKALDSYCKERGWNFELITLDNSKFNLLYNRAKRARRNGKTKEESINSLFG